MCPTYQEACQQTGLLEDDGHWDDTLTEAASCHTASKLRDLFAVMIVTCALSNPPGLWDKHKDSLAEDIIYQVNLFIFLLIGWLVHTFSIFLFVC